MQIRELIQLVDNLNEQSAQLKLNPDGTYSDAATGEPVDNTVPFPSQPQQPAQPGKFAKAWDATKRGAAAVGQGLKKGAAATAQGVQKYGPGVARGAANLATGTVKAAGDIAAQAAGGLGQTVGAVPGGFMKGYQTARSGGQFRADRSSGPYRAPSAPTAASSAQGSAETDADLTSLKAMIAKLDQRLGNLEAGKTS